MDTRPRKAIIDSGVLAAAANTKDTENTWALVGLGSMKGRAITCEAAITEAVHLVKNNGTAVERLQELLGGMEIMPMAKNVRALLDSVRDYTPRMDYADACAVALQKQNPDSIVITTDHADFSVYRVPFASPRGGWY